MTITNPHPPKPALIRTSLPLPAQDLTPDEIAAELARTAAEEAEATAALEAALAHFDAAEQRRAFALSAEQERKEREEQARIEFLRDAYPPIEDDVARFRDRFYALCAEETIDTPRVMEMFVVWSRYRKLVHQMKQVIIRYDSSRSSDDYRRWEHRVAGWHELLRSVTSWKHGGFAKNQEDDLEGLAAVNARIAEESQSAPRPLERGPADQNTPWIEDLGLRDPARVDILNRLGALEPLEFNDQFSSAVAAGVEDWSRETLTMMSDKARADFGAASAARTEEG